MEEDRQRRGVRRENDNLGDTTVQGLRGLVGTLLQLAVVGRLLNDVKDLLGESSISYGPG